MTTQNIVGRTVVSVLFSVLLSSCAIAGTVSHDSYPDIWWTAIPDDQVAGWEVPPQAADRSQGQVVLSKRNDLGQFSNLGATSFVLDQVRYASVEGLWQGMKYPESTTDERALDQSLVWAHTREQVYAMSGFEAKKAGDLANANMKKLGIKWVTYKGEKIVYNGNGQSRHYELILDACRAKVQQNAELKRLLIITAPLIFLADHKQAPDTLPSYRYNEIYFKIRGEILGR
ncbi:MAG: NADAR family protein [Bdellovibrio sp.]|nr:NADAR family protein [Bdellovibrio sp.]